MSGAETAFRMVRCFGKGISPSESRAYRVETSVLMTEREAMALMRELGSPYVGMKYDDNPLPKPTAFKLIKDGNVWDYSNLREDVEAWRKKILREEPEARVEIRDSTREEMLAWKEGW